MLYGWFTRIMNRPKKVNAVAVVYAKKILYIIALMCYNKHGHL